MNLPAAAVRMSKRPVDLARLIEMLAQGYSLASIGRELGYSSSYKIRRMLRLRGIDRRWIDGSVPVVEVRRGRAP